MTYRPNRPFLTALRDDAAESRLCGTHPLRYHPRFINPAGRRDEPCALPGHLRSHYPRPWRPHRTRFAPVRARHRGGGRQPEEEPAVLPRRACGAGQGGHPASAEDRKSTRLNSSHVKISYAVFCLKKKKKTVK